MSFLDKAKDLVNKHEDKVDAALEKIGDQVDRRTGHKYTSQIDRGVDEIKKRTGNNPGTGGTTGTGTGDTRI
ncbi:antitoxin [Actinoplanes sp. DH11]|uniref:antitoxin n=1 Tax=Actinoplanes sp. DH11 TaxID=2857011 RepID=UPI001E5AE122|nr:antitoxin [Actinoplanes sp. DH11]